MCLLVCVVIFVCFVQSCFFHCVFFFHVKRSFPFLVALWNQNHGQGHENNPVKKKQQTKRYKFLGTSMIEESFGLQG